MQFFALFVNTSILHFSMFLHFFLNFFNRIPCYFVSKLQSSCTHSRKWHTWLCSCSGWWGFAAQITTKFALPHKRRIETPTALWASSGLDLFWINTPFEKAPPPWTPRAGGGRKYLELRFPNATPKNCHQKNHLFLMDWPRNCKILRFGVVAILTINCKIHLT